MNRQQRRDSFRALLEQISEGTGRLPAATRKAAAGGVLEGALGALSGQIRERAIEVSDADVAAARQAGYTDEQLYELTVASALGASGLRLEAALSALGVSPKRGR